MATVVRRSDGRFEIRESVLTSRGPRSRTLAVTDVLTGPVLGRAESRATRPFDRDRVLERARRLGMPVHLDEASALVRRLLSELGAGAKVSPLLARVLRERIVGREVSALPDTVEGAVEWLGAPAERRGAALRELLRLSDRISRSRPRRPRAPLRFPRIRSAA